MKAVIEASRDLSGKANLGWLVSRVSRFTVDDQTRTWPNVIDAQNDIIGLNNINDFVHHTFPGPETDDYYTSEYRSDQVHFSGNGLLFLAQLWADKIDNSFLSNSTPYPALALPSVTATKQSDKVRLNAASGWTLYDWLRSDDCSSPISNSQEYVTDPGVYWLKATDSYSNVVYSPLLMASATSLPVTLTYFRSVEVGNSRSVRVSWATSSETNASHFEVLHSTDGLTFNRIATLDAKGTSVVETKYETTFSDVPAGHHYYRLREVDIDGTEFLSQINHVNIRPHATISLFPNPVENELTISSESTISKIEIYNLSGVKIASVSAAGNKVFVDFSKYSPGLYTIKIDGQSYKIVKSR